jgi:hypothetical protein
MAAVLWTEPSYGEYEDESIETVEFVDRPLLWAVCGYITCCGEGDTSDASDDSIIDS